MTAKLVMTEKRWKARQCASQFCKKPGYIVVQTELGKAWLCRKHYAEWAAQRQGVEQSKGPSK